MMAPSDRGGDASELMSGGRSSPKSRDRYRFRIGIILLAAAGVLAAVSLGAWRSTWLREAYIPQLEEKADREPNNAELFTLLGARFVQAGRYAPAARAFKHAAALGVKDPQMWITWAASESAAGGAGVARAVLHLGESMGITGLQASAEHISTALPGEAPSTIAAAICPDGASPLLARCTAGSFLNAPVAWWGRHHPAESGFSTREDWAKSAPGDPVAVRLWGEALLTNGAFIQASAVLNRAVQLAPKNSQCYLDRGLARQRLEQLTDAEADFRKCIELDPENAAAILETAQEALAEGDAKRAASLFDRVTKISAANTDAWLGLGEAYTNLPAHFADAVPAFRRAQVLDPSRTDYYTDFANALRENYLLDDAETILRQRLKREPADVTALQDLSMLLLHNHSSETRQVEAEKCLKLCLQLEPNRPDAKIALAKLYIETNRNGEGVGLLQEVIQEDPLNVEALKALARAYRDQQKDALAATFQTRAESAERTQQQASVLENRAHLDPSNYQIHLQLATLYRSLGRPDRANAELELANSLRSQSTQPSSHPGDEGAKASTWKSSVRP